MRKILLAMVLVLMLAVPAFATNWGDTYDYDYTITNQGGAGGNASATATASPVITNTNTATGGAGGAGGQAVIQSGAVKVDNKNTNTNEVNIGGGFMSKTLSPEARAEANQMQGQMQGQGQKQGQLQGQNNEQTIAPTQTTTLITEKPFVAIPVVGTPELNFGNGHMMDASKMLPKFKGVTLLKDGDTIHTVVDVVANVPFKKLYKTILTLANDNKIQNPYMRFQIIRAEGQKSWTTGGAMSGGGSGVVGTSGVAGGGSLIPSIGGTKAHDLFTIVVVNVIPE